MRCLYVCDIIPRNILIMTLKLGDHKGNVHSCEIQRETPDNPRNFSQIVHGWKEE